MTELISRQLADALTRSTPCRRETVVLVHGLAATSAVMRPLERGLRQRGFQTLNWRYRSIRGDIEQIGASLARELEGLCEDPQIDRVHLVTHSMGCIVARTALATTQFARIHRVVMLAPPHGGSRVAANLSRYLGWLCKPLGQLSDQPSSFVNTLPGLFGYEVGIIAAARDRVVRIENTCLSGQSEHVVVNCGHTSMLFQRHVSDLVTSFLQRGQFIDEPIQAPYKEQRHDEPARTRGRTAGPRPLPVAR